MFGCAATLDVAKVSAQAKPAGTSYYVDSANGNDSNRGTSPEAAWKSLAKVSATTFKPGDRILLKSGSVWSGQLWPRGSGEDGFPIRIDIYGGTTKPVINGNGEVQDAVRLYNQEYWEISNLEVTNQGKERGDYRGVAVISDEYGTINHIHLKNLVVHDVNGVVTRYENGGIHFVADKSTTDPVVRRPSTIPSRFVDLLIEGCRVYRVDRSAIRVYMGPKGDAWLPHLKVVIRNNVVDDAGGDGIVPTGTDGALVEYNVVSNCNRRFGEWHPYNAGIWPWGADNTVFQFNEAYLVRRTQDGQGFDSDFHSRNSLYQYNYSHDNEGGFMLICNMNAKPTLQNIGNNGTIVRYNISQNDKARTFNLLGPIRNTKIYNNTIYIGKGLDVQLVLWGDWNGFADGTYFWNNIFYAEGTARYGHQVGRNPDGTYVIEPGPGPSTNNFFDYNVYYGNHIGRPEDAHAITADPMLVAPGTGKVGRNTVDGYKLRPGSPAIDSGMKINDPGGRDYFGNRVLINETPDRGAHEFSGNVKPAKP
jgi:hypothetical protein